MATFDYDPKSGTLTLVCKVAETISSRGNPQLSLAEPYDTFRGGRPVATAKDAAGKSYPLFGSFAIGLAAIDNAPTPVVSRNVNDAAASASVDIAAIVANAVTAALAAQNQTVTVATPRRGRPLGSRNKAATK